jgi:cation:H+ antiporter
MILDLGRLALGGFLLYLGAEWLVKGAAGLARVLGVRPLVIGVTVVAYGTSAPELMVTLLAAAEGKSDIALGNVIGSNIANLGLILGATALVAPPLVDRSLARREVPVLLLSALAVPAALYDSVISRLEGALLVLGATAFSWAMLRATSRVPATAEIAEEAREEIAEEAPIRSKPKLVALALLGLALLVGGGKVFVDGAVAIAFAFGMSERVVGLTIVAIGTSLPELAASVVAALRGHSSLAIGNVIGSNIFNVLLVLGAGAAARPIPGSLVALRFDLWVMGGLTLLAAILVRTERKISRPEGVLLVSCYAAFLGALVLM